uniref:Ig-like domain-containing protein n=1 Tax=Rhodnius prolixus TaxID=13249 RepID=A0ABL0EJV5_RHOPR
MFGFNRYGSASNYSSFKVIDPRAPVFNETVMKENKRYMSVPVGDLVKWKCRAGGLPAPSIRWFKDEKELELNDSRIHISENNETLVIPMRSKFDDGTYKCIVSNTAGTITEKFTLKMSTELASWHWILLVFAIVLTVGCVGVFCFLFRKVRYEKQLRETITAAGLYYFQEGQIGSLNPDLSIGEQADLLPYDKKWEVPREKIKLAKTDDIKKPKITVRGEKGSGTHVVIGQNIVLECSVTVSQGVQIHFAWTTPLDNNGESTSIEVKHTAYDTKVNGLTVKIIKSVLALKRVTKDFEGLYKCTVIDNSNNTNQDEYELKVHSEDTSYLSLRVEGKDVVVVRGEGSKAEWTVQINAHPTPEVTWYYSNMKYLSR